MVSRKLMGVWLAFDALLLISGLICVILSQIWRVPDAIMRMVLSRADLAAGTILGIALITTFLISIVAIAQKNHVTHGFVVLNYALLLDAMGIIVTGTFVWWYTLEERANYHQLWSQASGATRIALQDKFQCCGYFSGSDLAQIGGKFCLSREFVDSLPTDDLSSFCVTPLTKYADSTLNHIFTTVMKQLDVPWRFDLFLHRSMDSWPLFFVFCWQPSVLLKRYVLSNCCSMEARLFSEQRQEDERFKKIDAKRGGQGFV